MAPLDNILRESIRTLERRLPPGWRLNEPHGESAKDHGFVAELVAPDGRSTPLFVQLKERLEPKGVFPLAEQAGRLRSRGVVVVLSRYLSEATRARLRERELSYLDLTGNTRVVVPDPGLFIETQGASEDPDREQRSARSLRGPKAGRIVRTLIDRKTPPGVRELATATGIDAGYVSRVLAFLDAEALITRIGHGRMESVDWPALLRRWAQEAPLESRGEVLTCIEPRGLSALLERLSRSEERYAVTGALAAARFEPVAPARLATIWVVGAERAADELGLRKADAGANVILLEPRDEGVFVGMEQHAGTWFAAPSQIAADLLTSPGRGPAEGEELIAWMQAHEEVWRR